jgi:hypothetical protein
MDGHAFLVALLVRRRPANAIDVLKTGTWSDLLPREWSLSISGTTLATTAPASNFTFSQFFSLLGQLLRYKEAFSSHG